jgi:hypothetical protein
MITASVSAASEGFARFRDARAQCRHLATFSLTLAVGRAVTAITRHEVPTRNPMWRDVEAGDGSRLRLPFLRLAASGEH